MRFRRFLLVALILVLFFTLWAPNLAQAAPNNSGGQVHIVRRGETLSMIAARYGISTAAIARANAIRNRNVIYVGQRLWIPTSNASASAPQNKPSGGNASAGVHLIRRGDTLSKIAKRYGVTVTALRRANNIRNANRIYVGQRLRIPGRSGGDAATVKVASAPAASAPRSAAGRWIEVDLSSQRLIAHEGNRVVLNTAVSTGLRRTPTPVGRYRVRRKIRRQTMSGPGYNLPNVQWVMYFVGGYSIHGTYWHNRFGRPMSHGCVNMRNNEAKFLYSWASRGTPVVVHR